MSEQSENSLTDTSKTPSSLEADNDAQAHDNRLGEFLRQRRKALGKTLAQVASECNYSLSLISKTELGQIPEGPTLKLLERLAKSLAVDITKLVQLKEEDASAARNAVTNVAKDGSAMTEPERQMMHSFRALDDRLQQNLLGQAQLIQSLQQRGRGGVDVVARLAEDMSPPPPCPLPKQLARTYEAIGREYHSLKWFSEAIKNYDSALTIYEQVGRAGAAARMWFHKGCILNHLSRYSEGEGADQQQKPRLDSADSCFSRADQLFGEAEANESETPRLDDEKEYVAENLRHWAINDMQMARTLAQEDNISPEYHVAMLRHYLSKAEVKQVEASELSTRWIEELESRTTELENRTRALEDNAKGLEGKIEGSESTLQAPPKVNEPQERDYLVELLAEAFHRKGLLHSNISAEQMRFLTVLRKYEDDTRPYVRESAADKEARLRFAEAQSVLCRAAFLRAIQLRRDLARTASTQAARDRNLSKLANNHQALAYATQNYSQPAIPREQYEYALYHYLLAEKIDALMPARGNTGQRDDPGQREAIHLHSTTLERDGSLGPDMRVAIRRRVETSLAEGVIGTREKPILKYDADYSVAESAP